MKSDELSGNDFINIANDLLNKSTMTINGKKHRIVEVEFYLHNAVHADKYTHMNRDQSKSGFFYFHKHKNGSYKGGTYKGMDITFGDEDSNVFFGILIRSIQNMETSEVIQGPCCVVNYILEKYSMESLLAFVNGGENLSIYENCRGFVIEKCDDLQNEKIYKGPRIGLSDKYPEFQNKDYRFLIFYSKIKKGKKSLTPA